MHVSDDTFMRNFHTLFLSFVLIELFNREIFRDSRAMKTERFAMSCENREICETYNKPSNIVVPKDDISTFSFSKKINQA